VGIRRWIDKRREIWVLAISAMIIEVPFVAIAALAFAGH
jgi:hypothetical protein